MKHLVLLVCLLLPAMALAQNTSVQCSTVADIAGHIMAARQLGTTRADEMHYAGLASCAPGYSTDACSVGQKRLRTLILAAWKEPVADTEDGKKLAVQTFGDRQKKQCEAAQVYLNGK